MEYKKRTSEEIQALKQDNAKLRKNEELIDKGKEKKSLRKQTQCRRVCLIVPLSTKLKGRLVKIPLPKLKGQ